MVTEEMMCTLLEKIIKTKKIITLREFIDNIIPKHFKLDASDLKLSEKRLGERMYEQRARNINCHRNFPMNVIYTDTTFYEKTYFETNIKNTSRKN